MTLVALSVFSERPDDLNIRFWRQNLWDYDDNSGAWAGSVILSPGSLIKVFYDSLKIRQYIIKHLIPSYTMKDSLCNLVSATERRRLCAESQGFRRNPPGD